MIKKLFPILLLLILILPTFSSLFRSGYFPMHDDMQAMRLLQMDKCIQDGQIPCRWVPDMGFGYGYPQFNYYAPLPYYAMEVVHLTGFGFLDSVKIGFILTTLIAAFGMYLLGESLWGKTGGLISSILYIYAPYRAVDFYVRGAVGELWALAILPLIFWSVKKVVDGDKKAVLWLALSTAALLASHNITSLIFMPLVLAWAGFLLFREKSFSPALIKKKLVNLSASIFWGLLISAFFVFPAWFEKDFVHVQTLLGGYFNYISHFVGIKQLLLQTQWGYGTSEVGPYDDILFSVGIIHWLLPLVSTVLLFFLKKKKEAYLVMFLTALGWLSLFMIHPRSQFIWDNIPILAFVQFPWRLLILATFLFSLASGSFALLFSKASKTSSLLVVFLVIVIFMFNKSYFAPRTWIDISDAEKFSGESWQRQQTISIFDYLPIYAEKPPGERAPSEPVVTSGEASFVDGKKGSNWQKWLVDVESDKAVVQLPIYYFPKWKVRVDGQETMVDYENELGLITTSLGKGKHDIYAKLTNTPIRSYSNLVSAFALLAIPVYLKRKKPNS